MRAIQFSEYGPPDVMHVAEFDDPHAGPGEIRIAVRASGVSPGEVRLRSGEMRAFIPLSFPYRTGFDAAGVVDEVGAEVGGVDLGDEVFGMTDPVSRGANAEFAVLAEWSQKPASWSWEEAGGAAGGVETAARVLDLLSVGSGDTVLVNGAAGGTGAIIVQFAVARGARVIGTASERNFELLRSLGVEPTTYGPGLVERISTLAPEGVDAVVDCAGGALANLIAIADGPAHVLTIADFSAADHGVHFSRGGIDALAVHGLATALELAEAGKLRIPVEAAFPLDEVAAAHALIEMRHARGKVVLTP